MKHRYLSHRSSTKKFKRDLDGNALHYVSSAYKV